MCTLTDIYFVIYVIIVLFLDKCVCDYDCLCNYNVEKAVYGSADAANKPIGYMYEFDCKQLISDADPKWSRVAFEHKVGFVEKNAQIRIQICPGDIPGEDKIITTTTEATTTTISSTIKVTQKPSTTQPLPMLTTEKDLSTSSTTEMDSVTQTSLTPVNVTTEIPYTTDTILDTSRPLTQTTFNLEVSERTTSQDEMQNWTTEQLKTISDSSVTFLTSATIYPSNLTIVSDSLPSVSTQTLDITSSSNIFSHTEEKTETVVYNSETASTTIRPTTGETSTSDQNLLYLSSPTFVDISSPTTERTLENNNITTLPITVMTVLSKFSVDSQSPSSTLTATKTSTPTDGTVTPINNSITQSSSTSMTIPLEISVISQSPLSTISSTNNSLYSKSSMVLTSSGTSNPGTSSGTKSSNIATSKPGTYSDRVDLCPYKYMALSPYNNQTMVYSYFRQYGKYCFELRLGLKNWFEAQSDCRARGGDLAEIPDQKTQDRIYDMVSTAVKGYTPDVWIGLNDLRHEGHWEWVNGQQLTEESYINTALGYSAYSDIHDCFVMDGNKGYWKNTACRTLLFNIQAHPWVCQYEI